MRSRFRLLTAGEFARPHAGSRHGLHLVLILAAGLLLGGPALGAAARPAGPAVAVDEFPLPNHAGNSPRSITLGPDNNLWFTEPDANLIGQITPQGVITEWPVPTANSQPTGIAAGPDGNVWFVESSTQKVGYINPGTHAFGEVSLPSYNPNPQDIGPGPDGNLWVAESSPNKLARVTGGSTEITLSAGSHVNFVNALPGTDLWATEDTNKIAQITAGGAVTEFPITGNDPEQIVAGADGNVWFQEGANLPYGGDPRLVRMTPQGVITEFVLPFGGGDWLSRGPDGNIWADDGASNVARVTPDGTVVDVLLPTSVAAPAGIAPGPNDTLWVAEYFGHKIARISGLSTVPTATPTTAPAPTNPPGATPTPQPTNPPGATPTAQPTSPPGPSATPRATITAAPTGTVCATTTPLAEGFESATLGAFSSAGAPGWQPTTVTPHSGAYAVFAPAPAAVSDQRLSLAAGIAIPAGAGVATLSFAQQYDFERDYDGGVLEVSTDGGASWTDAGPNIANGAYNGTLSTQYGNPLAGRQAWTGPSGGYVPVAVNLLPYAGDSVLLRFRLGTDTSTGGAGWWIDDLQVTVQTCSGTPPNGCQLPFADVPSTQPFYPYIHCLACYAIISGYGDGTYRPYANVTRGQLAKIIANAADFSEPPASQTFADVVPGSAFYDYVERLVLHNVIGGYACGGPGEPCDTANRPYFRPFANATRGQIAKIVAGAAGLNDVIPAGQQTFADVPPTQPFWLFVERLAAHGAINGYACGGPGEPCDAANRPYFRPNVATTRGQMAKIAGNVFFPGCYIAAGRP